MSLASVVRQYGEEWSFSTWRESSMDEYGRRNRSLVEGFSAHGARTETKAEIKMTYQGEERVVETLLDCIQDEFPGGFLKTVEDGREPAPVARSFTGALYDVVGVGWGGRALGVVRLFLARRSDSDRGAANA